MSTPMANEPDLDALLGAYALDALDPEERARVDAYLERNPRARDEADELRETAASLALAQAGEPIAPDGLWTRISNVIATERRAAPTTDTLAARRSARLTRATRWSVALAAAAVVAAVALGARVVVLDRRLDRSSTIAAAFDRAARQHGAREVALASRDGARLARIVLLPDGSGYLRNDTMHALPADRTYQLWAVTGAGSRPVVISAGVLGRDPSAVAFHSAGPVRAFAVTIERAPGVVTSTQQPIGTAAVS